MPTEGWKSTDDACAHCGISKNTLYKLVALGHIPAYKPSRSFRFRTADLDAYLESVRVRPQDVLQLLPKSVREELQDIVDSGSCDTEGSGGRCLVEGLDLTNVDIADLDDVVEAGDPAKTGST